MSLWEALSAVFGGGPNDAVFLSEVLRQYRAIRKIYWYEYSEEDKAALKACATDLRPFTYSFAPALATFWGLGRMVKEPKQLGGVTRAALVLLRLAAAGEVLHAGYLVGSYRQGMDCMRRLVALRSPLGGEFAALVRGRDPAHPLLKFERPPAELLEDGSRPRIVSEPARLAQIAHFRRQLASAKAGQAVDHGSEADRLITSLIRHQDEALAEVQQHGSGSGSTGGHGPGVASQQAAPQSPSQQAMQEGALGAAGVSAVIGGAGLGMGAVRRSGGLVISDPHPPASAEQQRAQLAAAVAEVVAPRGQPGTAGSNASSSAGGSSSGQDPLALLLEDGGSGDLWGEGQPAKARRQAEEEARRQRRRERWRSRWWWRHGGRSSDAADGTG